MSLVGVRWIPLVTLLFLALGNTALAVEPVNQTFFGVAIKGYDPVAYFGEGKPTEGSSEFSFEWKDAEWRFASAENRDRFAANPEQFAPQYGGYCAYAVSQGGTANIDPAAWRIVDEKLYLNLSPKIQALWLKDRQRYIEAANENWPRLISER